VILAVYAACVCIISIAGVMTAGAIVWITGGSWTRSGPGLVVYGLGMVAFLWPALYLIGELDRWRKRGRAVIGKRS
jgi:hypothetical protein